MIRVSFANAFPNDATKLHAFHLEKGISDEAQTGDGPFEAARFLCKQTEVPSLLCRGGTFDRFAKIKRHCQEYLGIVFFELRQQLKDRAVAILRSDRTLQHFDQLGARTVQIFEIIFEVAIRLHVEGNFVELGLRWQTISAASNQHRVLLAKSVTRAEFVKRIGVMDGDIR